MKSVISIIFTLFIVINVSNAQLIGSLTTMVQGGVKGKTQMLTPQIGFSEIGEDVNEETLIFQDVMVTLTKNMMTYEVNPTDENFEAFVATLTSDRESVLKVGYQINRINNYIGKTSDEWFETDFTNKEIGRIELIINKIDFATPGTNKTGDGNWTDFICDLTINVYGTDDLQIENED